MAYNIPGIDNTFASYYYSSDESSTDVAVGALTKMSMFSKGWINYTYDNQGQLLTAAKSVNGTLQKTYTYTYDTCGNIRTTTDGSYSVYYWLGNPLLAEERHTSTSTKRGSCKMNVLQLPLQFLPAVNFAHRLYSVGNVNTSQVGAYYSAP